MADTTPPDSSVVDAHVHFWDPGELEYPWLQDVAALRRAFGLADYRAAMADAPIEKLVFVEGNCRADQSIVEVERVERLAEETPPLAAIVAYVELTRERERGTMLERLSGHKLVKGIRHNIQGQPPGFALQRAFVRGVQAVSGAGFTFDLCITHDQLKETLELVRQCGHAQFMLDHCAKPAIKAGEFEPWATDIRQLAQFENVSCKISGLLTEAGKSWRARDIGRFASHVVDVFGADRVVFGSDWPVVTLAGEFQDWFGFTRAFTSGWSTSEKQAFYHDNAARFYGFQKCQP